MIKAELNTYFTARNVDDEIADDMEIAYTYFSLNKLANRTTKFLFLDIMYYFGKGYVAKVLQYITKHIKKFEDRGSDDPPKFKEEYAIRYLNSRDVMEQFLHVIRAIFNVVDINTENARKIKNIIELFHQFALIGGPDKLKFNKLKKSIINYV